jgi:hypothetical protein
MSTAAASKLDNWRQLELTAALPSPEQLLLVLEVALLEPRSAAGHAVKLLLTTVQQLEQHGCLGAAVELLWSCCCSRCCACLDLLCCSRQLAAKGSAAVAGSGMLLQALWRCCSC